MNKYPFENWYFWVDRVMIYFHYHSVDRNNTLLLRLYEANCTVLEAIDILHNQWVSDANLFASKLLEQTQTQVTFTVWHEFLANNKRGEFR